MIIHIIIKVSVLFIYLIKCFKILNYILYDEDKKLIFMQYNNVIVI